MPISQAELTQAGKTSIDVYMRNNPIDSVNAERPFLQKLMAKKKPAPGGKQYMYAQVRKGNDSNFQSFYGSETVSYNRKDTVEQASYEYDSFHDGFSLHEDDFIRNGITIADGPAGRATSDEKVQLTNLFEENIETLRLGYEESLDVVLHCANDTDLSSVLTNLDSAGSGVFGLSDMVSTSPATGTYAGISRSNAYWQNHANTAFSGATGSTVFEANMRAAWRACTKYGGRPDCILVGSTFLDAYIDYMMSNYGRVNYTPISQKGVEMGEGGVFYQGVPMVWDPTFDYLSDNSIENTIDWKKRCYFLNTKFLQLKPIKGQWMVSRTPPRVYNKYEYYWALTSRFYLANTKPTAHAVLSIS